MGMSGEVWRFRVEESRGRNKSLAGGAILGLKWELVDADGLQHATEHDGGAAGGSDDATDNDSDYQMSNSRDGEDAEDGNMPSSEESDVERHGNGAVNSGVNFAANDDHSNDNSDDDDDDLENDGSDDGVDGALNPAALFNLPPAAQSAQHGAWQALAAAAAQGAGGGVEGDAQAAHAALQAAIWAQHQHLGMNINFGDNQVALDADGNPTRPSPRCAASWTCMPGSNKIYLFGGLGQENDFLSDLWCFDAGARGQCRWERLTAVREDVHAEQEEEDAGAPAVAVPDGRWGHTMVEHKGSLYMFGGSSPGQAYTGLWRLDSSTRPCRWSLLAHEGEQPPPRGGHSATVVGDTLYIFGGNITQVCYCRAVRQVAENAERSWYQ